MDVMAITKRAYAGADQRRDPSRRTKFHTQIPKWMWERMSYIVR
jgi:hypothetical protein